MKTYNRIEFQMVPDGLVLISEDSFDYEGAVEFCKGGDEAKAQQKRANDLQDQQLAMQKGILDRMNTDFGKYADGSIGYDPSQLAMLKSQFMGQSADRFNDAGAMVRGALASRGSGGGDAPPSGDYVRGVAGLASDRARNLSGGLANIDLQNLQQALTNKFNAGSLLSGNAATLNSPIATLGGMSSNALNQYMQQANSGFGASFMRGLGGGLAGGIASGLTGGLGKTIYGASNG